MRRGKLLAMSGCVLLTVILMLSTLVTACAQPAPTTEVWELDMSFLIPDVSKRYKQVFTPWMNEIEERTGGRVKITPFPSSVLTPQSEAYDAVKGGVADIASFGQVANPGRFPISEVLNLAPIGTFNKRSSRAFWEFYKQSPEVQAEYPGVKVLFLFSIPQQNPASISKPIRSLDDLRGMKMLSPGTYQIKMMQALGAAPVSVLFGEAFLALEKGVADGIVCPYEALSSWRFGEVIKYMTDMPMLPSPFEVVMNIDVWNSFPRDIQKIIDEVSGDHVVDMMDEYHTRIEAESRAAAPEKFGIEIFELSAEEKARWIAAIAPVRERWVADIEAKGLPGSKLLEKFDRIWDEYAGE